MEIKEDANAFYADPLCQDVFHNFLATINARTNTETGIVYRCSIISARHFAQCNLQKLPRSQKGSYGPSLISEGGIQRLLLVCLA